MKKGNFGTFPKVMQSKIVDLCYVDLHELIEFARNFM